MRKGQTIKGKFIVVEVLASERLRLGITTSRRFGRAHQRNRFRRIVREAFRKCQNELPRAIDVHVLPRQSGHCASSREIATELMELLTVSELER